MKAFYKWLLLAIAVIVTLFTLQNMARIDVAVLFWVLRPHLSVVILASFAVGFVAGWLVRFLRIKSSKKLMNVPGD